MDKFIKIWTNAKDPKIVDKVKEIIQTALISEFPKRDVTLGDTFQNPIYRHYAAKIVVIIPDQSTNTVKNSEESLNDGM